MDKSSLRRLEELERAYGMSETPALHIQVVYVSPDGAEDDAAETVSQTLEESHSGTLSSVREGRRNYERNSNGAA
jgi:hypothetical protein